MHIPDGFLSTDVALVCAVPAAVAVGVGLRKASTDLDERRVPLLGVTAAFVFADGGITALGANVLNMGVIGALLVGGMMHFARRLAPHAILPITAIGAWLAVMLGATATSLELAISGTVPLTTVVPAMLGTHALIGVGEAIITVAAVSAVLTTRPDLVTRRAVPA